MLNELDQLSKNIGRLIAISGQHQNRLRELESQVAHARAEHETLHAEVEALRSERDALRAERDALSSKIDDAQVRLNAILEKLPHSRTDESQLDLLTPVAHTPAEGNAQ
ncbi:ATPase [Pararobbsia silviterrae]|uniref:ATPase n=1 Tax=Pararobbsia silviterrae TaxID=1792498 RepID=A0A494Y320_9BURK|nr:ATPase [Pararobbsia silviterrae]RKP56699.1 ATPase [Pararobbsia silviterrae]